ncbi:quercetin 2,3-dioxygenase [Actinokineospora sp. PR83]|uniref:quercetin 2,3-dioxygenase n=1 Tax=Actinokineospora sp. PR83 TaxID=2884908 RepID=UPI0027E151A3|nr:quercetin 2,3-dioxygenase [Actinokineospora sp. PR83]MCG8915765.1 quercetin 2,3-dioxygenase [Actinokineospora sp. PR83]
MTEPLHVPAGQGTTTWFDGSAYTVKADTSTTAGALSVLESSIPPGSGPPLHIHTREDEAFYVLSGELEFHVRDDVFTGCAGDFVFVPRGTPHRFRNTSAHVARTVFLYTPAGFEELFLRAGDLAVPGQPIPRWGPDRFERATRLAADLGWEGPRTETEAGR